MIINLKVSLIKKLCNKLKFDDIDDKNLSILENPTYDNLYRISLALSDGVIFASDIKKNYIEMIKKAKIPVAGMLFKY